MQSWSNNCPLASTHKHVGVSQNLRTPEARCSDNFSTFSNMVLRASDRGCTKYIDKRLFATVVYKASVAHLSLDLDLAASPRSRQHGEDSGLYQQVSVVLWNGHPTQGCHGEALLIHPASNHAQRDVAGCGSSGECKRVECSELRTSWCLFSLQEGVVPSALTTKITTRRHCC